MDADKYVALRTRIKARFDQYKEDQDFLIDLIRALERRINDIADREAKNVCKAGSMNGDDFVRHEYDVRNSTVGFTLQIEFSIGKHKIVDVPLHFFSECRGSTFLVRSLDTSEEVEQPRAAATSEAGQLAIIELLDLALDKQVDEALND